MKKLLSNFEEIIAGFFLIITVLSVVLNVFYRSIGLGTISTSEEIATISFVWSVYIGAVACYKRKMHIGVDMLVQMLSKKGRNIFAIFLDIFLMVVNFIILYLCTIFIMTSQEKPTPVLGISSNYLNMALLISFFLMSVHSVIFLFKDIKKLKKVGEE
ncbi:TRAP transporter small permease [Fusobacterium canifelinum]|uniref:TRAP transporter small permease n=1 Tax=Fusobacterium canifelinum TaxID=285729 RepID=A0A7T9LFE3_9FUSO|nr:TRAP transporter small permease [Fusobacterium canifelinum]QQB73942.1 TRAP transporter small permease [Fusobacterium canifelinum]QQS87447.1 TRAP transporter small permease [Fusobacterium canifelinum]